MPVALQRPRRLTLMMRRISVSSIDPSPLQSYIRKAISNFLSAVPCEVMLIAWRNSLKSILPLLSREDVLTRVAGGVHGKPESKARKTCSQKFSARPLGKNCL